MLGGIGDDELFGDDGPDDRSGGSGSDTLSGGGGISGRDVIDAANGSAGKVNRGKGGGSR